MSHEGNAAKAERDFEMSQEDVNNRNEKTMNKSICPICNKEMAGEIHNARPVVDGFCCDACNTTVVIPTRLFKAKLKRCWT